MYEVFVEEETEAEQQRIDQEGSMSDWISRQDAIDSIADYLSKTTYTSAISHLNTAALILARVPSAQPETIRCKDCSRWCICHRSDEWYCADAERRKDG